MSDAGDRLSEATRDYRRAVAGAEGAAQAQAEGAEPAAGSTDGGAVESPQAAEGEQSAP